MFGRTARKIRFGGVNDFHDATPRDGGVNFFLRNPQAEPLTHELETLHVALGLKVRAPFNGCINVDLLGFVDFRRQFIKPCLELGGFGLEPFKNTIKALIDLTVDRIERFANRRNFRMFGRIGLAHAREFLLCVSLTINELRELRIRCRDGDGLFELGRESCW